MTGLVKQKQYDWKDSNLALFGSDTEKQVKKESAESEPAWQKAGQKPGLQIWRIVKFEVKEWPKEDYGKFYNGDSYIVLNTYKEKDSEELNYDVHFWIGKNSTQDEYGTAAYKTVELDTYLDDKAIQHREVQGHESSLFKSYFPFLQTMEGGADTGFRHVKPEEYKHRLMHVHGDRKKVTIKEVPLRRDKLTEHDVFILDFGLDLYQWNGKSCNKDEKFKAAQFLQTIKSERSGRCKMETVDEEDADEDFYNLFDGHEEEDDEEEELAEETEKALFRLSDSSGQLEFSQVSSGGDVSDDQLDNSDVFILDTGKEAYVWVGSKASKAESKNAMSYAHKYLQGSQHPLVSVCVVKQGKETKDFRTAIAA